MNKVKLYQIDAFTDKVFGGNPAAVCVFESWLDDNKMQQIAAENNLAETAFIVKNGEDYDIRWFTPTVEVDLCGHATLAAAFVLFNYFNHPTDTIRFHSHRSGLLKVAKAGEELTLDFPVDEVSKIEVPEVLVDAFGKAPLEAFRGKTDYLLIFSSQKDIESFVPDIGLINTMDGRGVIVSASGYEVDFVSRFFAPQVGIDEDPVTGSAHTTLTPVWANKLGKSTMLAKQLSKRKGDLKCELVYDRVRITGKAVTYLIGEIFL
jgi:predicted PhzF superfamily epimerase YddE/YHI9